MAEDVLRDVPPQYPVAPGLRVSDRFNLEKVSWGAIWAGVMVTVGMEALFLSFGIFIAAALGGSVTWTAIWYLVTMAVSFYVGAWCAARLSDVSIREICMLHGIATWGLSTLATLVLTLGVLWAALQLGTTIFVTRVPPGSTVPFSASAAWSYTVQYAGIVWGGIILSLFTASIGGRSGQPNLVGTVQPQAPAAPIRRAS